MIILEVIQMLLLSWSFVVLCEMSHYNVSVVLVQFFVRLVFVYRKKHNYPPLEKAKWNQPLNPFYFDL